MTLNPEALCAETIRVDAIIQHVENTLKHWSQLQRKPNNRHHQNLLTELREIQSLSAQNILDTQ